MLWAFAISHLTVCLCFVNRAGKVICSKHPAVISIWLYFVLQHALCYLFTIENLLPFVRGEFSADSFIHSLSADSPLYPALPASLCLSPMHLSPLLSINTHFSPFKNLIPIDLVTYIHINTIPFFLWLPAPSIDSPPLSPPLHYPPFPPSFSGFKLNLVYLSLHLLHLLLWL